MAQAAVVVLAKFFIAVGVKAAIAQFAATVFVYAASAYLLNRAAKSLTPKSRAPGSLSGAEISYFDTGAPMRIAYGRVRTGGMETIPPLVSGANNKFLHKVLTLTGHEVDSYNFIHFDTSTITNAMIGPMAFTSSDGMVTSGVYSGHAYVRRYRGTSTDSADRILCDVTSAPFSNFRGLGIGKVALTFIFNDDIYKSTPQTTFTYQGRRCYDPRLDSSPGADPTNASFAAWTQNPALALADYLMADYGGSYASDDIDWSTVVTAANYCDDAVTVAPVGTQPRYTINGVLIASDEFQSNVKTLVDAMLGRIVFSNGKWRMYAGSWKTPDFSIEKADWISGLSIKFEQGKKKRFNRMRVWFIDQTREWQRVECFPRSNSTYLTADKGIRADAETEQLMCTDQYEAQRKGEFLLRQSRNQITVAGRLPPRFQNIALWDTGTIVFDDLGWSSKTFRAVSLDINEDGSVDGVFAEEQSDDWSDSVSYDAESSTALPLTNSTFPSEPRNFSVAPQVNGTILFSWDKPIVNPIGSTVQIIRSTNSGNAAVGTVVWEGAASPVPLVQPTSAHWYWSRTHWKDRFSDYFPNTYGLGAIARLEADQTLQNRLCGDAEFEYGAASSLWQVAIMETGGSRPGFRFSDTAFGGTRMQGILVQFRPDLAETLLVTSYNPIAGQYGGLMACKQSPTVVNSQIAWNGMIIGATPLRVGSGHPYNGHALGVEYEARIRINSLTEFAGFVLDFGMLSTYDTPNSLATHMASGICRIESNAAYAIGQFAVVRGFGVVMPACVPTQANTTQPLIVTSAQQFYMRPYIAFWTNTTQGNFDVDYFQATAVGHSNEPRASAAMQQGSVPGQLELYEFYSMVSVNMAQVFSGTAIIFPSSETKPWADWRQYQIGRKFTLHKPSTNRSAFICPSSGMTLRLAGRAAVGTVTFVTSLPGLATIEKTGVTEFTVNGTNGSLI